MKVVYAELARLDISAIYDRIALKSTISARRVEDAIRANCEKLADLPGVGALTDHRGMRRLPVVRYPYTVFYRVDAVRSVVEIARVFHGARVRNLRRMPKR